MRLLREVHPYKGVRCFVARRGTWLHNWIFNDPQDPTFAFVLFGVMIFGSLEYYKDERLKRHEYAHIEQARQEWFFSIRYYLANRKFGYWDNPYEEEARACEELT